MYNTVSPIHVQGMPVTGGGVQGCTAPPKFPNLQKKFPKLLFASKASLKNWEFYVFLDKEIAYNSGKGPILSDLHPLRHSENQEDIHF